MVIKILSPLALATLVTATLALAPLAATAAPGDTAADPVVLTGQVGCTMSWNYAADQLENVRNFAIVVDAKEAVLVPSPATAVACAELGLVAPDKLYKLRMVARPQDPTAFAASKTVHITVRLSQAPSALLPAPTGLRLSAPVQ